KLAALEKKQIELCETFTDFEIDASHGQGLELYYREAMTCPTESQYFRMISLKSSSGMTYASLALSTNAKKVFGSLQESLRKCGLFAQIRDDLHSLTKKELIQSKSKYEDITEGKFSFLVVYAVQKFPNDSRILDILKKRTTD